MRRRLTRGQAGWLGWLLLGLSVGGSPGCHREGAEVEETLRHADTRRLRRDAAVLYRDLISTARAGYVPVQRRDWPKSFEPFLPLRVNVYVDGVALAHTPGTSPEAGLYVVPQGMEHTPAEGPRTKYRRLAEGVYWYRFGEGR